MRTRSTEDGIEIGGDCDHDIASMAVVLVRLAGWKRLLEALEGVAVGSGQPAVGGTILAAREWLYGHEEGDGPNRAGGGVKKKVAATACKKPSNFCTFQQGSER